MDARWNVMLCVALIIFLLIGGCSSLNTEGVALLEFRSKVVLDPYGMLKNWSPLDDDPCKWQGVHCADGKVYMLDLNGLSLQGALVPELGELRNLRALLLFNNNFSGIIPKEIGKLSKLELLDLRSNNLSGTIPDEIIKLSSIKFLLLYGNRLNGSIHMPSGKLNMISKVQFDENLSFSTYRGFSCINRKIGECFFRSRKQQGRQLNITFLRLKRNLMKLLDALVLFNNGKGSLYKSGDHSHILKIYSKTYIAYEDKNHGNGNSSRRMLLQGDRNLPASAPVDSAPIGEMDIIQSSGTGSFLATATQIGQKKPKLLTPSAASSSRVQDSITDQTSTQHAENGQSPNSLGTNSQTGKGHTAWIFIVIIVTSIVSVILASILLVGGSRKKKKAELRRAGLSAKLQKALTKALTEGVPKLSQEELELACEDFCNIIQSCPEYSVYKGTLCSGVEIAVLSTMASSSKDWTEHMEEEFRKKIESLSRVNHKNFVNLLGYCDDEQPFVRMMVFEYAPSGTLSEHIHGKGFEHLDWGARMRIIMGIAYCLQYMHHELNPPVVHPNVQSKSIFLTDDYAAKISEIDFWKHVATDGKTSGDDEMGSETRLPDPSGNVYDFGVLLLEIISGKETHSQEGFIVDWASAKLDDKENLRLLTDPSLKAFKGEQLDIVCEVIKECVYQEPNKRPTMKDVAEKLRQVLTISPDSATPRLSPLWWAELEVLSQEAS